jgi:hypothetical protein
MTTATAYSNADESGLKQAADTANGHETPLPSTATPIDRHNRGGAPKRNHNRTTHGHRGSNQHPSCKSEQNAVNASMTPVLAAAVAKHGSPLPPAVDNLLMQIRRAHERDRIAAKLLRNLKDLKGDALTHDQQVAQRDVQATALRTIETCLDKLGIGITTNTTPANDWAAKVAAARQTAPNAKDSQ